MADEFLEFGEDVRSKLDALVQLHLKLIVLSLFIEVQRRACEVTIDAQLCRLLDQLIL